MIADELGTRGLQPVVLVGVGNLGLALLSYRGFEKEGFEIVAAFDTEPRAAARQENHPAYLRHGRTAGVRAQARRQDGDSHRAGGRRAGSGEHLVACGITGILNFSPIVLSVPEEVMVNNVNLAIELENLSYFIQE